jgi:hypothetical protein
MRSLSLEAVPYLRFSTLNSFFNDNCLPSSSLLFATYLSCLIKSLRA